MTQKAKCIAMCKEFLTGRAMFNESDFKHYYRKHNGSNGNPYTVALSAADFIIRESQNRSHDRRNES